MDELMRGAEAISMLVRLKTNMDTKLPLPIRASEMGLLILAATSEHPPTSIEMAEFLKVSKPMIAAMVNSLVGKGYLMKEPVSGDKRKFALIPTETARTLVEETFAEYHRTMALLRDRMGADSYLQMIGLIEQANQTLWEDMQNG